MLLPCSFRAHHWSRLFTTVKYFCFVTPLCFSQFVHTTCGVVYEINFYKLYLLNFFIFQIVEYTEKCPRGFLVISKTYDQDQDADLWREQSFLKRKSGRYLCLSKSEGLPNFVVQDITVVNEKSIPPEGYSLLHRTADTEQKAWRKKQLCYRLANYKTISQAVTDIIVCNRLKRAPDGFTLAGFVSN